jgi:DNA ligase 1
MRNFAALFESLDTTTSTRLKIDAMVEYFRAAEPADAAWATYVLMGRRLKRSIGSASLHQWLSEEAQLPQWLIEETYASIGDMAETIALLVAPQPERIASALPITLTEWFEQRIIPLARMAGDEQRQLIVGWWHELPYRECFLVNKLLTGSLRVGVSRSLVARALAELFDQSRAQIERALIGSWHPNADFWRALAGGTHSGAVSHPYPFYLASPLEGEIESLGNPEDWLAEWKWDGIRGQIVRRAQECTLWSRGEEIISERFPELIQAANALPPGTVLDGEVLAWGEQGVASSAQLQKRIGRRSVSAKLLQEIPTRFLAYDLIEWRGEDWRARPLRERRTQLQAVVRALPAVAISISPAVQAPSWPELAAMRERARAQGVEGLMLKQWHSTYGTGRQRGA